MESWSANGGSQRLDPKVTGPRARATMSALLAAAGAGRPVWRCWHGRCNAMSAARARQRVRSSRR